VSECRYSRLYYHRVQDKPVSLKLLRAAHSILWILCHFLPLLELDLECLGLECGLPKSVVPDATQFSINRVHVIKPTLLSFFFLFFLPIGYNMPFLCPHVTCQLSRVRLFPASISQAQPASLQPTTGQTTVRLCQAQSSLTLDHLPSFLRHLSCHSPSRSMSLSFAISLSHSVA